MVAENRRRQTANPTLTVARNRTLSASMVCGWSSGRLRRSSSRRRMLARCRWVLEVEVPDVCDPPRLIGPGAGRARSNSEARDARSWGPGGAAVFALVSATLLPCFHRMRRVSASSSACVLMVSDLRARDASPRGDSTAPGGGDSGSPPRSTAVTGSATEPWSSSPVASSGGGLSTPSSGPVADRCVSPRLSRWARSSWISTSSATSSTCAARVVSASTNARYCEYARSSCLSRGVRSSSRP
ncbi:hypothetical protein BC828DRAFT_394546 [Blastocladiella britannica]|nr:hypothetical protein BC828DRAFT_394546 [Blastocladiella britannica]